LNIETQEKMQLTTNTIAQLDASIAQPQYDRANTDIGIVHLGPGAFFRSHQAWFTEQALNLHGGDWGICAVALNSNSVKKQLKPQQGLYSLVELDKNIKTSVIGAVKEVLAYQEDFAAVISYLCAPKTKIVTLTITEKGYYQNVDGHLDLHDVVIKQDLANPERPTSAIGLLVLACQQRLIANIAPLAIISCDNVSDNGKKLKCSLVEYAQKIDQTLADHIQAQVICPGTMVDSITPATDDALAKQLFNQYNYQDNWPIKREAFTQWVIEDILPADIPAWHRVGVTFTQDVAGYEMAKLRVLNATHSTMAYLGCLLGIKTVYDAIHQESIQHFIREMLTNEVKPSFSVPSDMNFEHYCQSILQRYRNPEIKHLLAQIAWDGSQKLPMRIIPVIVSNLLSNQPIDKCCITLAAWMRFVVQKSRDGSELIDPLKNSLLTIGSSCTDNAEDDVNYFLTLAMFSELNTEPQFTKTLINSYTFLCENNADALLTLLGTTK